MSGRLKICVLLSELRSESSRTTCGMEVPHDVRPQGLKVLKLAKNRQTVGHIFASQNVGDTYRALL